MYVWPFVTTTYESVEQFIFLKKKTPAHLALKAFFACAVGEFGIMFVL